MQGFWKVLGSIAVWLVIGFVFLNPALIILMVISLGEAHRSGSSTTPYGVVIAVLSVGWVFAVGAIIRSKIARKRRAFPSTAI